MTETPSPTTTSTAPRRRRNPLLIAVAVAGVCVSGLLSAWLYTTASDTEGVLAARSTIQAGQVISDKDVLVVQVNDEPGLQPLPAADRDIVVGKRAGLDIAAGSLLTKASVTEQVVPGDNAAVVGLSLSPAQMPSMPLRPGDQVRVLGTPGEGADVTGDVRTVPAIVVSQSDPDAQGLRVVDVQVTSDQAPTLAARAASGRVALILDSRAR